MNIKEFIISNGLKAADAIILRKKLLGMVDHYAIYLGYRNNNPVFVANYRTGVKEISTYELREVLKTLEPCEIDPFPGQDHERAEAVKRALSRVGEKAYNYLTNNCEHFKNWVHRGINSSTQVNKAGNVAIGLAAITAILALYKKNPKIALIAFIILLIGIALKKASNEMAA